MRREFSAGGVLVRRLRGRWFVAAIRPAGRPAGLWALPKGQIDKGESGEAAALRGGEEETGGRGRRLGDKSRKYAKGMIVSVLVGARYGPRQHVFDAVIDKVDVKRLGDLSPREIEHDNPEIRRPEEMAHFLGQLYNREVTDEDTVTVIRFSAVRTA